jgi:cytochrome oxidase assembly protein ShyY1
LEIVEINVPNKESSYTWYILGALLTIILLYIIIRKIN